MSTALPLRRLTLFCMGVLVAAAFFVASAAQAQAQTTSTDTQASCTAAGRKWCTGSNGMAWCQWSGNCPANNATDCAAQNGTWCPAMNGGMAWCATSGMQCPSSSSSSGTTTGSTGTTSGSTGTTTNTTSNTTTSNTTTNTTTSSQTDEQKCLATSGSKWCKGSTSTSPGWCQSSGTCPAYTETDCKAISGEWCVSQYGGSGWCASGGTSCPINDKATCLTKGRKWCESSGSSSGGMAGMSYGWCTMTATESCPSGSTTSANTTTNTTTQTQTQTQTTPVPTMPNTPATPTMPAYSSGWPQNQSDCEILQGKWCPAVGAAAGATGGWCMSANKECPPIAKEGYMVCWDNSQEKTTVGCPFMPQNEYDCKDRGKNWCKSMGGMGSGWCSAQPCEVMAPAGKMTCPDAKTFVTSFAQCPKKGDPAKPPETEYKTCTSGAVVRKSEECPTTDMVVCANGAKAKSLALCEPIDLKKSMVTQCMDAGGTWCADAAGQTSGWCAMKGMTCSTTMPKDKEIGPPDDQMKKITAREIKEMELMRKSKLRDVADMSRRLKRSKKNAELLAKVVSAETKLKGLQFTDSSSRAALEEVIDMIDDLRAAVDEVFNSDDGAPELDEAMQKRALDQMKRGAKSILANLKSKRAMVDKLVKAKVAVDPTIRQVLEQGIVLAEKVVAAPDYASAREAMESVPDVAERLNDLLPQLEVLSRVPSALKVVDKEFVATDKAVKAALAQVKRRGLADVEQVQAMQEDFAAARAKLTAVRAGTVEPEDVLEVLQGEIVDKLQHARELADGVIALSNARAFSNKLDARMRQYAAGIKKLERAGDDTGTAQEAYDALAEELKKLQALVAVKITPDTAEELLGVIDAIGDLQADMENEIGTSQSNVLKDLIKKTLENGGTEFDTIEVDGIEKLIVKAHRSTRFALDL